LQIARLSGKRRKKRDGIMKKKFIIFTITGLLLASLSCVWRFQDTGCVKKIRQIREAQNQDSQGKHRDAQSGVTWKEKCLEVTVWKAAATVQKMQAKTKVVI